MSKKKMIEKALYNNMHAMDFWEKGHAASIAKTSWLVRDFSARVGPLISLHYHRKVVMKGYLKCVIVRNYTQKLFLWQLSFFYPM